MFSAWKNVPILQHVIASKSSHINTMLPNVMVLAPLQKLKIKYELSYQSTTRLKYIDKFDQLLITLGKYTTTIVRKKRGRNDVTSCDGTSGHVSDFTSGHLPSNDVISGDATSGYILKNQ
jgi:hypothetical protein